MTDEIPCVDGYRSQGICQVPYCPFKHPTDKEYLHKQEQMKSEFITMTQCQIIKKGGVCLGGPDSNCGLKHKTPIRYCDIIAAGEACSGGTDICGYDHINMPAEDIYCIDGRRRGKECTMKVCIFRHPGEKLPSSEDLIDDEAPHNSLTTVEKVNPGTNSSWQKCPFILRGIGCSGN